MRKCLTEGASRFGWDKRKPEPRSMRNGRYLIGQGMAGAIYTHWRWPVKARVTLNADGSALAGMHEIGGGTYTVMQQVAADALGFPPEKVVAELGDTRLLASHPAIGSATMANAGASVLLAARAARGKAIMLAVTGHDAPFAGADARPHVRSLSGFFAGTSRRVLHLLG
jgi:xanthine dehydrogenase YagR molybdenum-binding subunit